MNYVYWAFAGGVAAGVVGVIAFAYMCVWLDERAKTKADFEQEIQTTQTNVRVVPAPT